MSFWDWLEKFREKPEKYKCKVAFFLTAAITLFIAIVWLIAFFK